MPYRKVHRFLGKRGFSPRGQTGSHVFYQHEDGRTTTVPHHSGDIHPRLVAKILKEAGIDPDEVRR